MPTSLPYLPSYKNVAKLFERIREAKQPDAFTQKFLYETIGLKSLGDRPLIPLLRTLGFVDGAGKPTPEYAALKNQSEASRAIARAIRRAYAPLFEANESAHELPSDQLRGLVAQVAGSDADMTGKIVGTLNALLKLADFSMLEKVPEPETKQEEDGAEKAKPLAGLRSEFHYNIQIHLPANSTEETYLNIFNALRKVFK